jgi:hypothetical protein
MRKGRIASFSAAAAGERRNWLAALAAATPIAAAPKSRRGSGLMGSDGIVRFLAHEGNPCSAIRGVHSALVHVRGRGSVESSPVAEWRRLAR